MPAHSQPRPALKVCVWLIFYFSASNSSSSPIDQVASEDRGCARALEAGLESRHLTGMPYAHIRALWT